MIWEGTEVTKKKKKKKSCNSHKKTVRLHHSEPSVLLPRQPLVMVANVPSTLSFLLFGWWMGVEVVVFIMVVEIRFHRALVGS